MTLRPAFLLAAGALFALAACGSAGRQHDALPKTAYGPEGMAVQRGTLLAAVPHATGASVAGVPCLAPKKPGFHIHSHLAVYIDGHLRPIPAGIGMVDPKSRRTRTGPKLYGPRCYYQLHVHAQDGVIHVEAPTKRTFTLGQFFALWGQPLSPNRVGSHQGRVTVYLDGRPAVTDPTKIVLRQREVIQIVVGKGVAPKPVDWSHF